VPALELAVATVILVGVVTVEVPIGFVVDQTKLVLQLLDPIEIVQLEAVMVPAGGGGRVVKVSIVEKFVPVAFVA
jgi:hypothetical protein